VALTDSELREARNLPDFSRAEMVASIPVRTRHDAERCVSLVNYPPGGLRGWGPFVAHSRHKTALFDYVGDVGPQMTCC
jgi:4-hydroxy-2-oxoheptanedioate aldolase